MGRSDSVLRTFAFVLSLALLSLGALFLMRATGVGRDQLNAPYSLGPAEAANLETIKLIRAGKNPYGAETYLQPPFVLTQYTPLYHYIVARLPIPDANPFRSGRLVAAAALVLASLLPFLVAPRGNMVIPLAAFCLFHSFGAVVSRTVFLRTDALAVLLSGLIVVAAHRARKEVAWGAAAALLSLLAVSAKQSFLAAPLASALYLLVTSRRAFRWFLVSGLCGSAVFIFLVYGKWGPHFWFCTLGSLRQPISMVQAIAIGELMAREPLYVALGVLTIFLTVLEWRRSGGKLFSGSPYFLWVVISLVVLAVTIGKRGSGTNYFFESILAQLMWATHTLRDSRRPYSRNPVLLATGVVLAAAGILEIARSERSDYSLVDSVRAEQMLSRMSQVRSRIDSLGFENPSVVGILRHPEIYRESDRVQLSSPVVYLWLWSDGVMDVAPFLKSIERGDFDIILLPRGINPAMRLPPPFSEIVASVFVRYRLGAVGSGYGYYVGKGSAEPNDSG